jgi:hypothetical protein
MHKLSPQQCEAEGFIAHRRFFDLEKPCKTFEPQLEHDLMFDYH